MRRCVIFDMDGTLNRSDEGILNCARYAMEQVGCPVPGDDQLRQFVGPPLMWSFQHIAHMDEATAEAATAHYRARYAEKGIFENRVYPGIRRLLRTLKQRGDWVAVATGKGQATAQTVLDYFGLAPFVDRVVGQTDDRQADKQALILAALPEDAGEAWMVGDRRFDVEGGLRAGVHTIGVGYGYGSEDELRTAGCEVYVPTVAALIDFLCPGNQPPEGFFLSMEGLDGSGKSTQIALLTDMLDRYGYEVVHSREPGGCPISEKIRDIILDPANQEMAAETEALLYAASRAQHVRQVIRPTLNAGKVLLCDRFVDSSVAYQGGGRALGVPEVLNANHMAVDGTLPLCTVYLDIDPMQALGRRLSASSPDRLEQESSAFFQRVSDAYHALIARDPQRFVVVDATQSPEEIGRQAAQAVLQRLMEKEQGHG